MSNPGDEDTGELANKLRSDEGNEAPTDASMPAHMRNMHELPTPSKGTDVRPAGSQ